MILEQLQRIAQSVPGLPRTLRQSLDNPIQQDRLPSDTEAVAEFPVASVPASQIYAMFRNTFLWAAIICLLRSIPEYFLPISIAYDFWGLYASVAACAIIVSLIGKPTKYRHWLILLFFLPALVLYILYLRSIFALLLLAALGTALVADNFTKQTLYLGSTTPYPREQANRIRKRWASRFFGLHSTRGMELYGITLLVVIATPFFIDGIATEVNPFGGTYRLPATFATLGIILLSPIFIELIASLLYNRKALRITYAWKAFRQSIVQWLCYNANNIQAPGLLQSPIGSAENRRRIVISVIVLWAAALNPLISYRYNMNEQLSVARARTAYEKQNPPNKQKEEEFLTGEIPIRNESFSWDGELDPPPAEYYQLQPFQQELVAQLPVAQREEYVAQALELTISQLPERIEKLGERTEIEEEQPARFLLLSQLEHPFIQDAGRLDKPYGRLGFMVSATVVFIIVRECVVLFLSFIFPFAFLYAASIRIATSLREQLEVRPDTILSFGTWNSVVDQVATANKHNKRTDLFVGTNKADGSPVVVPRKILQEHAHILGDSGSGKTSMGVAPLLNQLINQQDCSVVVLDLKGDDKALFRGAQLDALEAGKRFRWFTNELGKSSYGFNPLAQEYFSSLSLYQKTDVITAAMGLQYGTDYGRGFYSDANAEFLYRTLQEYPTVQSFEKLAAPLRHPTAGKFSRETLKAASHLVSVVNRLASTEALNLCKDSKHPESVMENQIEFAEIFRKPEVVYFHLPSSLGTSSAAEIARVALFSILGSARQTAENERKQVFVFIDEFQRIVANNLELIMQTARSMKIGLILANQSLTDLKKSGVDLMPTVRTNTRYKQVFAASNIEDLREIVELSGEALVHTKSFGRDIGIAGLWAAGMLKVNSSESTTPRLRVNDVLLASDAPDQSIVQIRRGDGLAQYGGFPFVMRSQFHIDEDEYLERKSFAWPSGNENTILASEVEPTSALGGFTPVDPITKTTEKAGQTPSELSGIDDLFKKSEALLKKRERRRNKKNNKDSDDSSNS